MTESLQSLPLQSRSPALNRMKGSVEAPTENWLEVSSVSFSYQAFQLEAIQFAVRSGEFVSVLGSNGSGKSTLLKLISGFLTARDGSIRLAGRQVNQIPLQERARRIALVAQESHLTFPMTVRDFVLQGRRPYLSWLGFETKADWDVVEEVMSLTDCLPMAARNILELSGGEKQRVILARALAQQPQLMLLDEPTIHLDVGYQMELVSLIRSLSRERRFTTIMVTHELNIAAEFSDKLLLLNGGRMVAFGLPEQVLREEVLREVFRTHLLVDRNPVSGGPRVTPVGKLSE
ncbi:MAG: ABC transporter ATP-binding protein [Acidobacteriota bacterium]